MKSETVDIIARTHAKKSGKAMGDMGMRSSLLTSIVSACKVTVKEDLSGLTNVSSRDAKSKFPRIAGGKTSSVWVHKIGTDLYNMSWHHPKGRGGEGIGKFDLYKNVTFSSPQDAVEYIKNIQTHTHNGNALTIAPVNH